MSKFNPEITNDKVIPVIESDLFDANPSARFAVGILAVGNQVVPGLEKEYTAYFDLRRNVYVDQTGQLDTSAIRDDGTDRDEEDGRSVAFGVIENRIWDQRVVGATRIIIKGFGTDAEEQRPLPVETFCPEVFDEDPAPIRSIEVSRHIARHERAAMQEILRWQLYAVSLGYVASHALGPVYGVVEPWLQKSLQSSVPVRAIGEPRYVPHYLDYNVPIEIDSEQLFDQMKTSHPGLVEEMQANEGSMTYFGNARPYERRNAVIPIQVDRRRGLVNA
jgi:hypothetical protein